LIKCTFQEVEETWHYLSELQITYGPKDVIDSLFYPLLHVISFSDDIYSFSFQYFLF